MGWVQLGTQFPTDILIGIAWTSQAFLVISTRCSLSSTGQLTSLFSASCFTLYSVSFVPSVLCLFMAHSQFVPSLFVSSSDPLDCLPLSAWNSLPLCHCHCVTFHREVATCPLTNWAAALPRTVVILVISWNDSFANSVVKSDFKPLYASTYSFVKFDLPSGTISTV